MSFDASLARPQRSTVSFKEGDDEDIQDNAWVKFAAGEYEDDDYDKEEEEDDDDEDDEDEEDSCFDDDGQRLCSTSDSQSTGSDGELRPRRKEKTKLELVNEYLEEYGVLDLLNRLTAILIYYRPDKPKQFLCDELKKMKNVNGTMLGVADFLNEGNAAAIFDTMDPTRGGKGTITNKQYTRTLMQIDTECFDKTPDDGKIVKATFLKQIMKNTMSTLPECPQEKRTFNFH